MQGIATEVQATKSGGNLFKLHPTRQMAQIILRNRLRQAGDLGVDGFAANLQRLHERLPRLSHDGLIWESQQVRVVHSSHQDTQLHQAPGGLAREDGACVLHPQSAQALVAQSEEAEALDIAANLFLANQEVHDREWGDDLRCTDLG